MAKIVTLGEIMLRLSPAGQNRFVQVDNFNVIYGGGEANVAVSAANYGHDAYFVTKLPKHEIGQAAVNSLRRYGVNTQYIARGGNRVGIYYAETGASMRPSKVIYDRAGSSIAEADPEDFDFDEIFKGADWFHWSGITPAISDKAAKLTELACKAAKKAGATVSVDLNFRKKLWTSEKAISIMRPLMKYVDVCIGNEEDAELCLGFKPDANVEASFAYIDDESSRRCFSELLEEHPAWIIEELICQAAEMAQWNESSVNTVRVPTFLCNGKFTVIWTRMRTGKKGAIVDNLGSNGIVVSVDPQSGTVTSDGVDNSNNHFEIHPDSGLKFKGWQVPRWAELLQTAEELHRKVFGKHVYIAWDFALTDNGWVLVEGNWGQLLGQQTTTQIGLRRKFHELVGDHV